MIAYDQMKKSCYKFQVVVNIFLLICIQIILGEMHRLSASIRGS
jgi:hypothetical protein